jgi:hypothetical protein
LAELGPVDFRLDENACAAGHPHRPGRTRGTYQKWRKSSEFPGSGVEPPGRRLAVQLLPWSSPPQFLFDDLSAAREWLEGWRRRPGCSSRSRRQRRPRRRMIPGAIRRRAATSPPRHQARRSRWGCRLWQSRHY